MTKKYKIYNYNLPYNYSEKGTEFDFFSKYLEEKYCDSEVKELYNYRVATNGVVFKYFDVLEESCINEKQAKQYGAGYKFFLKYIFPQINFDKDKTFMLINDEWAANYYHWHIIALQKLLALKEKGLIENSLLILPIKNKFNDFIIKSIAFFGVKKEQILFLKKKSNIKTKKLLFPVISQNNPENILKIQKILFENTKTLRSKLNFGDKIYISREKCSLRKVENELEVVGMLEKYGFKKVLMEDYSYEEQIAISANAKYVISSHGAGLTNILFMEKGGFLLELAVKEPTNKGKVITDYFKLCNIIGINYLYQECQPFGEISQFLDLQKVISVDIKKLEKNIQLMLKK